MIDSGEIRVYSQNIVLKLFHENDVDPSEQCKLYANLMHSMSYNVVLKCVLSVSPGVMHGADICTERTPPKVLTISTQC